MGKTKKQTIEDVEIVALGHKGMCIGKTKEGEAVLVKGAVPGDIIDLAVRKRRNKMKWGVPLVIKKRSPHRVEPTCEHFEHCGGCSWQDLSYEEQARQKEEGVYQTIRRIGHVEVGEYKPIIGAQETLYYRNKMVYSFSKKRWMTPEEIRSDEIITEPGLGFYAGGSFDKVINVHTCHLQKEPTNLIRNHVRTWALREGWTFYDARAHEGDLRNLMIRSSRNGDVMVTLVTGSDNPEIIDGFVKEMTTHFPQVKTVAHILNQKWNDSLQDLDFSIRHGKGYIIETLNNVDFRIGPKSFFQTNPYQAEYLFDAVKQAAGFNGSENLYDLYCGVGTIGLYMSEYVNRLVGVEEIPEAIDDAKINAKINNIENANFEVGDVKVLLDQGFMDKYGSPDVIITDPPRAGMHENVVKVLAEKPASKMIYVSCNPATQARDLQRLSEAYSVESIQPVDMFPQTNHVESIALLKSR